MKLIQVKSNEGRWTIPKSQYETVLEQNRMNEFHRTVYTFESVNGVVTPLTAVVNKVFGDIDKNPLEAVEKLYGRFMDYRKVFITSGNGIHFVMQINKIPTKWASITQRSFFTALELELGIKFDATSDNLLQMRRAPNSRNPKNGRMCLYFDPVTFETSTTPIVTGSKPYNLPIVEKKLYGWTGRKRGNAPAWHGKRPDPNDLSLEIPANYGHFDRIDVARQLRNRGVWKEDALEFLKSWLPNDRYSHMLEEGIVDRIYSGRL